MRKETDSEDDIWDYKSSSSTSGRRGKPPPVPVPKNQPKGQGKKRNESSELRNAVKCKVPSEIEVIDVDSDFVEGQRVISKSTTDSCQKKGNSGPQSRNKKLLDWKSKKTSPDKKRTPQSKKKLSISPQKEKDSCHGNTHGNIQNFFSQKSVKRPLKRKSSESEEIFICSSSDENGEVSDKTMCTSDQAPTKKLNMLADKDYESFQKSEDVSESVEKSSEVVKPTSCTVNDERTDQVEDINIAESGAEDDEGELPKVAFSSSDASLEEGMNKVKVVDVVIQSNDDEEDVFSDSEDDMNLIELCQEGTFNSDAQFSAKKQEKGTPDGEECFPVRVSRSSSIFHEELAETSGNVKGGGFVDCEDFKCADDQSTDSSSACNGQTDESRSNSLSSGSSGLQSRSQSIESDGNLSSLVPVARKQTSLFSFFKPKFSSSVAKTKEGGESSQSGTNNHKPGFAFLDVKSRPDLRKEKTFPSGARSVRTSKDDERPDFKKSYSGATGQGADNNGGTEGKGVKGRKCPFYKKIPGTAITVDAFRYGVIPDCQAYVLTHFHYDHYGGLTKKFAQPIFCSPITANLVESRLGVDSKWINRLPMWQPCQVAGVTLTLMEANHCPGAVIILFELKNGTKILHTGDFRANPEMEQYQVLKNAVISELYLDTTYCNPSYAFPPQVDVIDFVVSLVAKHMKANPQTLIVCGAYTIGKERIFTAIAKELDSKICVMSDKKKVLDCLEDPELKSRVTLDWAQGQVHVLPMGKLNQKGLFDHLARHHKFKSILAFQPTGWTHTDKTISLKDLRPKWSSNGVTLYGVPYSEHSSFLELKRFVQFTRPLKILPTVNNGNPSSRQKMEAIFKQWMSEKSDDSSRSPRSSQQSNLSAWVT
ncbi:uncharacterized protein LOC101851577 [Aplysia californica]|uniref:Uncharacterized protein LOC101851577 n=1 Tax=Aplysia californica TaxID=6500 RepID=A0ABM0JN15_APLCA|nr:uncharacterized protein LOC101851577 [Aplysia californica]